MIFIIDSLLDMCGIFTLLNNTLYSKNFIDQQFQKGINRGPEFSKLIDFYKIYLGFHRLAINGLNENSNQPFIMDNIILICNGEIFNYKQLYQEMNITPTTDSDCEVIIHLYKRYGMEHTLQMLDGTFAFVLLDNSLHPTSSGSDLTNYLYIARDTYGVCPLYYLKSITSMGNQFGFSSELKCLSEMYNENNFGPPIPINNSQITNINDDKKLQYCLIILYRIICDYYINVYKKNNNSENKKCLNKLIKFHNEIFEIEYQKIELIS
jgi:asparagine synthetase B (glutamine-hydrolysing)